MNVRNHFRLHTHVRPREHIVFASMLMFANKLVYLFRKIVSRTRAERHSRAATLRSCLSVSLKRLVKPSRLTCKALAC